MPNTPFKAAAVFSEPGWFDLEASVQKTVNFINEAAQKGCKLIGFPEVWIPGYPIWMWNYNHAETLPLHMAYRENSLAVDSEEMRRIRYAARDNKIFVSLAFSEIDQGTLYMAQSLIGPDGNVINHRRKIKPSVMEKIVYGDGTGDSFMPVSETELGRVGQLLCWEHINPFLKALAISQGEQIHIAAWPLYQWSESFLATFNGDWAADVATLEYAVESSAWVIAPFQRISAEGVRKNTPPGLEPRSGEPMNFGNARIFKPGGAPAVPAPSKDFDGLLIADIDINEIHLAKAHVDLAGHYSRPDLIRLLVDTTRKELITELGPNGGIKTYSTMSRLGLDRPLGSPDTEHNHEDSLVYKTGSH